jgi:hypothetical protein
MIVESNKTSIRRYFDEVWVRGDLAVLDDLFVPGSLMVGAAKANVAMMRPAFSDIRATVDDLVAEGDKVAAYVSFTGSTRVRCSDSRQPARRLPSGCCYGVSRDRCPSGPTVSRRLKKVRRLPPSPERHDCPIVRSSVFGSMERRRLGSGRYRLADDRGR